MTERNDRTEELPGDELGSSGEHFELQGSHFARPSAPAPDARLADADTTASFGEGADPLGSAVDPGGEYAASHQPLGQHAATQQAWDQDPSVAAEAPAQDAAPVVSARAGSQVPEPAAAPNPYVSPDASGAQGLVASVAGQDPATAQGSPAAEANPYVDPTLVAQAADAQARQHAEAEAAAAAPMPPASVPSRDTASAAETATPAGADAKAPASSDDDLGSTGPIPLEALRTAQESLRPEAPSVELEGRPGAELEIGSDTLLSWAARTDVGLVRGHNEDSYLVRNPLFGVCDGMGGHAAGEVASAIAVRSIGEHAPEHADDPLLGAAIEAANEAVIEGARTGKGKPGMGCTATFCLIEQTKMAVAHVGDSRIYLLRAGTLVRITHDHSYVEELVDAGEITADEARLHPSRSIITRALGSDPDMYADHFTLEVERGDRIIVCSDGLSSMIPDSAIESLAVSSATPSEAVDSLVTAALDAGGHDNVTVIVVDVVSDGREEERRRALVRGIVGWICGLVAVVAVVAVAFFLIVSNSWYVGTYAGKVGIYQGVHGSFLGIQLSQLSYASDVQLSDLPEATQHQLAAGISVSSQQDANATVDAYARQIQEQQAKKQEAASGAQSESQDGTVGDSAGTAGPESSTAASSAPAPTDAASPAADSAAAASDTQAQPQGGE